jgi:hypothetical protein
MVMVVPVLLGAAGLCAGAWVLVVSVSYRHLLGVVLGGFVLISVAIALLVMFRLGVKALRSFWFGLIPGWIGLIVVLVEGYLWFDYWDRPGTWTESSELLVQIRGDLSEPLLWLFLWSCCWPAWLFWSRPRHERLWWVQPPNKF